MEYGMNQTLQVHFTDLQVDALECIEFIFKQEKKNEAQAIKHVVWTPSGSGEDVYTIDDPSTFYIPFSREDTFKFLPNKKFYIDARIHYVDIFDNPSVPVVAIEMEPGLFGKGDNL